MNIRKLDASCLLAVHFGEHAGTYHAHFSNDRVTNGYSSQTLEVEKQTALHQIPIDSGIVAAQQDLWRRTESCQRSGGGMNPMELLEYHLSWDENGLTVSTTKDQTNLDFNFSESSGWWTTGKKLSIAEMIWLHNLIRSSGIQGVLQSLWRNTEPYQRGFNETRAA